MTHAGWRQKDASRPLLQLGAVGAGGAIRAHLSARPRHLLARVPARPARTGALAAPRLPGRRQYDRDATKTGTIIGATTTPFTNCTGATTMHRLSGLLNEDTNTFAAATLFLSLKVLVSSLRRPDKIGRSTRLNSSHRCISYAVFCLKEKSIHPCNVA